LIKILSRINKTSDLQITNRDSKKPLLCNVNQISMAHKQRNQDL